MAIQVHLRTVVPWNSVVCSATISSLSGGGMHFPCWSINTFALYGSTEGNSSVVCVHVVGTECTDGILYSHFMISSPNCTLHTAITHMIKASDSGASREYRWRLACETLLYIPNTFITWASAVCSVQCAMCNRGLEIVKWLCDHKEWVQQRFFLSYNIPQQWERICQALQIALGWWM